MRTVGLTVKTDDVEAAHAEAVAAGYEIVHPLTTVVTIAQHRD